LSDDDVTRGTIGRGLARILGLCQRLHLDDCPPDRKAPVDTAKAAELAAIPARDFSGLGEAPAKSSAAPPAAPSAAAAPTGQIGPTRQGDPSSWGASTAGD